MTGWGKAHTAAITEAVATTFHHIIEVVAGN